MVILHKDILAEYLIIKFGGHENQLSQKYYVMTNLNIKLYIDSINVLDIIIFDFVNSFFKIKLDLYHVFNET